MLHIVKIPNNEGDINNMRKFILGLSFLGFGDFTALDLMAEHIRRL